MAYSLFVIYLAASFIRPFEMLPDLAPFRPMVLLGGAALLVAVVNRALEGRHLSPAPQLLLIPLLLLWAAFTVFATQRWLTGAIDTIVTLSSNLFIFYLLVFNLDTLRRVRTTLHVVTLMRIALAQLNPTSGDIDGNTRQVLEALEEATRRGAELLVAPEMVLPGYCIGDLIEHVDFLAANERAISRARDL